MIAALVAMSSHLAPLTKFPLLKPGYSFVVRDIGESRPAHNALFLLRGNMTRQIRSLDELRGTVKIGSEKHALQYVRLLTSPGTQELFKPEIGEVIGIDHATLGDFLGNAQQFELMKEHPFGLCGIVSEQTARELGVKVTVHRDGSRFHIRRLLFKQVSSGRCSRYSLYWVRETVRTDGAYAAKVDTYLKITSPQIVQFSRRL